jgi:hypothetical protein
MPLPFWHCFGQTAWTLPRTSVVPLPLCWRGCGQLKQVFGPTFFTCQVLHNHPLHHSATANFDWNFGFRTLICCWHVFCLGFEWNVMQFVRTLCVFPAEYALKLQNIHSRSNCTLGFLQEYILWSSCKNRIAFHKVRKLHFFSASSEPSYIFKLPTHWDKNNWKGETIWTEHAFVMPSLEEKQVWWTAITYLKSGALRQLPLFICWFGILWRYVRRQWS